MKRTAEGNVGISASIGMLDLGGTRMKYEVPRTIELTEEESTLHARIPKDPQHDDWHEIADAMEALVSSLLDREAVSEVRLRLFCDPLYAESGSKSRQQVFESNGTSGTDIFLHPHFIPYLRHFNDGPDLPIPVMQGLCNILNQDRGTSGMLMDQYRKYARSFVCQHKLNASSVAIEFFRLGVEIGMEIHEARTLRDAARSTSGLRG